MTDQTEVTNNSSSPVVLIILDGWGVSHKSAGNAIEMSNTPFMDKFTSSYPHALLSASGQAVGMPKGEDGNTETGHLNLGAGSIIYQDLERINMSIAEGSFYRNEALLGSILHAKEFNSNLHLMGLVGEGGVHSNIEHLYAILHMMNENDFRNVYIHLFTDGRDSPTMTAKSYISSINEVIKRENVGSIASVMGRYWSMDRDERWERTEKAYLALTQEKAEIYDDVNIAIEKSYSNGKTDEFIEPSLIRQKNGQIIRIGDNDSVIFFNFRIDRPRQLTKTFVMDDFSKASILRGEDPYLVDYKKSHTYKFASSDKEPFNRGLKIKNLHFVTMTDYGKPLTDCGVKPAYPPMPVKNPLGKIISEHGLKQLRITETEKERFVTYYFNGLKEDPFENEERIIIPSPSVPTYDLAPEMSAKEITATLIDQLKKNTYSFVVVNFPNADMVGHTGNIGPAVKAIEFLDSLLGDIFSFSLYNDVTLVITADHGNAEEMINLNTGAVDTEHSTNPVPFIVINKKFSGKNVTLPEGILADVAPTILSLLGIDIPSEMTGRNLLSELWK